MNSLRLIPASLEASLELDELAAKEHLLEYSSLSFSDDDPLGAWLKRAKAKGETKDSDQVLLNLLVHLHRKIDALSEVVLGEKRELLKLELDATIEQIGFEGLKFSSDILEPNKKYYARILMPIFPRRHRALYLVALSQNLAKIEAMHEEDRSEWDAYVAAKEREMIRALRA